MPYGRSIPYEKREEDIKKMKSLGLNALRTAHYSHDEDLINIADKLGILILEEIPVYWACDYKSNETFKLAAKIPPKNYWNYKRLRNKPVQIPQSWLDFFKNLEPLKR